MMQDGDGYCWREWKPGPAGEFYWRNPSSVSEGPIGMFKERLKGAFLHHDQRQWKPFAFNGGKAISRA
jgi:hypothetical protein